VDLHDVEEDALRAVVLKHPEYDREGGATAWDDGDWPTPKNGHEGESLHMEIYGFWKAARLMRLRVAPPSTRTWYNLMLAMVGEMTSGSCQAPDMFLGQTEASNVIDISIHLWCGATHGASAVVTTTRLSVLMTHLDVMSQEPR
jgi:hypothetical protein